MIEDTTHRCECPICRLRRQAGACEALDHVRNARREMLLAAKSLIDCCLDRLDDKTGRAEKTPARKVDIT
jgi:hypothetical protein